MANVIQWDGEPFSWATCLLITSSELISESREFNNMIQRFKEQCPEELMKYLNMHVDDLFNYGWQLNQVVAYLVERSYTPDDIGELFGCEPIRND